MDCDLCSFEEESLCVFNMVISTYSFLCNFMHFCEGCTLVFHHS